MRLTLRQLQIFIAVAETGTTTAAGARIALSQSAISGALNELEGLLSSRLFDRVGKRLVLNDVGRALLPRARAALDDVQDIEAQFGMGPVGGTVEAPAIRLRVGASTPIGNYLLPALVASYRRTWPAVSVDVRIGNTREVAAAVARLDVDIGLIEGPCHEPDLRVQPWLEDELVIVCAPSSAPPPAGSGAGVPLEALRQASWLLREVGSGTRETVEQALLPKLHHLREEMQFGSTEAIKQAAVEGLGLACLSRCAVEGLVTLGRLVVLKTDLPKLARRFYLVHHARKRLSGNLQRFVAHCVASEMAEGGPEEISHRME